MTACCERFEEYLIICTHTDERYELVRGKVVKLNPLTVLHYRIAKFLERVLDQAIEEYLDPDNWEFFRETGQRTEDDSSRLPDLAIVSSLEVRLELLGPRSALLNQLDRNRRAGYVCVA